MLHMAVRINISAPGCVAFVCVDNEHEIDVGSLAAGSAQLMRLKLRAARNAQCAARCARRAAQTGGLAQRTD